MDTNTKPVPSVRAALQALVDAAVSGKWLADAVRDAEAALAAPYEHFGLTVRQESKYTTCPHSGRIINRATGSPIPDDEPIMIFRAKDVHASAVIPRYHDLILETGSTLAASCFERFQAFTAWRDANPSLMKKPD